MKIALFCIPAHGHTNPTLGLVKALTEAGHQVWYFSFEEFRDKIESAGATFIGCDGYDFEMEDKGTADRVGKDKVYATELLVDARHRCQHPDDIPCAFLHILCRVFVEGKSRGR